MSGELKYGILLVKRSENMVTRSIHDKITRVSVWYIHLTHYTIVVNAITV